MSEEKTTAVATTGTNALAPQPGVSYGFEESNNQDIIIPRIKVINALSPERVDGVAEEGDVLNSLTQEKLNGQIFIPIKQYYSNIYWNPDRDAEQRMFCRSFDGRIGEDETGCKGCQQCGLTQFDNTKTGKDAQPKCTAYINFLGFIAGNPMPVVLSFSRTNYNEGRKLLSMAKSLRCSIWNYGYRLESRQMTKGKNRWYILTTAMAGQTSPEDQALAFELFKAYEKVAVQVNYEESAAPTGGATSDAVAAEI